MMTAAAINVVWAILFWLLFFVLLSWHAFRVPMGLGGALYPVFFVAPVGLGSVLYQFGIALMRRRRVLGPRSVLAWTVWIPCGIIALVLIVCCPMDSEHSYLGYVWHHVR